MPVSGKMKRFISVTAFSLVVVILIVEIMTPLGYADWLLYVIPLFLAYWTENPKITSLILVLEAIVLILGYLITPPPLDYVNIQHVAVVNRSSGYALLVVFTITINRMIRAKKRQESISTDLAFANKELESFSYSAAHDLKAPLRAIKGMSEILLESHRAKLDDNGLMCLERIHVNADKMTLLINSMITLSKVSLQRMQKEKVNISQQAETILSEMRREAPERRAKITIQKDLFVHADKNLLEIAMHNLLENAWKYTVKKETAIIAFGVRKTDGQNAFFVKDNGVGFETNNIDTILEPFRRLHAESEFPGSGIGLSIVDRIIRKHGGHIWAKSMIGKGSTFYFTLPG